MAKYEIELDEEVVKETGLQVYQDLCRLGGEHAEDKWMAEVLEKILEVEFNGTIPMGYGTEKIKKIRYDND
jgi:hypothetical protein